MIFCAYFEKDEFFVLVEVQGRVDVSRDICQAFGKAVVKFEAGVSPYFVVCQRTCREEERGFINAGTVHHILVRIFREL